MYILVLTDAEVKFSPIKIYVCSKKNKKRHREMWVRSLTCGTPTALVYYNFLL